MRCTDWSLATRGNAFKRASIFGDPVRLSPTEGQVHDFTKVPKLLGVVHEANVVADQGYDSDLLIVDVEARACIAIIPREPVERGAAGSTTRMSTKKLWRAQREQDGRFGLEAKHPDTSRAGAKDRLIAELEKRKGEAGELGVSVGAVARDCRHRSARDPFSPGSPTDWSIAENVTHCAKLGDASVSA
jgi:hypothetical protein